MPWILQMVGFTLMLIGIAIALWISVWVLLFLFGIGLAAIAWMHIRQFLTAKGILNPKFGVPAEEFQHVTIDADFSRVDDKAAKKEVIEEYKNQ